MIEYWFSCSRMTVVRHSRVAEVFSGGNYPLGWLGIALVRPFTWALL